jgi:hypothetical protein
MRAVNNQWRSQLTALDASFWKPRLPPLNLCLTIKHQRQLQRTRDRRNQGKPEVELAVQVGFLQDTSRKRCQEALLYARKCRERARHRLKRAVTGERDSAQRHQNEFDRWQARCAKLESDLRLLCGKDYIKKA